METNFKVSKGEIIVFTWGEYSNYGIAGFASALQDFDMGEKAREFHKETGPYPVYDHDLEKFLPWLIQKELVKPEEYREMYLGAESFDDDFKIPRP